MSEWLEQVSTWWRQATTDEVRRAFALLLREGRWMVAKAALTRVALFCQFNNRFYRVVGCSLDGKVLLASDFSSSKSDKRVSIDNCKLWSKDWDDMRFAEHLLFLGEGKWGSP